MWEDCLLLGSLGCCDHHSTEYQVVWGLNGLVAGKCSDSVTRFMGIVAVGGGEKVF